MVPHQYAIDCPSFLCAPDDRVGLDGIAGLFQEAAWQHAGKLGVAFTEAESEVFWALHRLGVRVHRRPLWGESVTVTTWPSRIQRLYAMREYEIRSKPAGELLVEGSSAWIVLRTRDSRPVPPARYFPEGDLDGAYSIEITAGKLPLIADTDAVDLLRDARWHQVRPSDTDRNAHVNNARYAQWFLDEAPGVLQPLMEERSQATLLLSFTAEARIGQEFAVIANAPGETLAGIAEIRVRDPAQPVEEARCACRLQWLEPDRG
jgi:medium-chain acyl-[acyl-carrier-protein] hydrolase